MLPVFNWHRSSTCQRLMTTLMINVMFFTQIYVVNLVNYENYEHWLNHCYEIKVQFFSGPSITYKDDHFVKHIFYGIMKKDIFQPEIKCTFQMIF